MTSEPLDTSTLVAEMMDTAKRIVRVVTAVDCEDWVREDVAEVWANARLSTTAGPDVREVALLICSSPYVRVTAALPAGPVYVTGMVGSEPTVLTLHDASPGFLEWANGYARVVR